VQTVTAALLLRDGRILLALRKAGKHMGRKWEFPGGKVHPGETPEQCLERELAEELDIRAGSAPRPGAPATPKRTWTWRSCCIAPNT